MDKTEEIGQDQARKMAHSDLRIHFATAAPFAMKDLRFDYPPTEDDMLLKMARLRWKYADAMIATMTTVHILDGEVSGGE